MELSLDLSFRSSIFLLFVLTILFLRRVFAQPQVFYPPGPPSLPLIGNLLDIPTSYQWRTYAQWRRKWGDVISVSLYGQRIIVANSLETATDLLDKHGAKNSDRPVSYMVGKLLGWDQTLTHCPYNPHFRSMRRVLHRHLGGPCQVEKMEIFHGVIESEIHKFLLHTLNDSNNFVEHARKTIGAIILRIGYGYQVIDGNDPLIGLIGRAVNNFAAASVPGTFLVDVVPALRWIPSWLPRTEWKKKSAKWRNQVNAMVEVPFKKAKIATLGTSGFNLVSDGIMQEPIYEEDEYNLKMAVASLYPGGADKTLCATSNFLLAMVLYPNVQKKAQRELDYIVGIDRLPRLSDRNRLPYLNAICSEIHRWNPVAPLGLPRCSSADNFFQGYLIPRGSLLFANIWHILRDPDVYSEPLSFRPERFIGEDGKAPERDPRSVAFGFGKRACPGVNLAEAMLFVLCATTLAVFDISKAIEDGEEVIPSVLHEPGTVSHPLPFKCQIRPRSSNAEFLIRRG